MKASERLAEWRRGMACEISFPDADARGEPRKWFPAHIIGTSPGGTWLHVQADSERGSGSYWALNSANLAPNAIDKGRITIRRPVKP